MRNKDRVFDVKMTEAMVQQFVIFVQKKYQNKWFDNQSPSSYLPGMYPAPIDFWEYSEYYQFLMDADRGIECFGTRLKWAIALQPI